MTRAAQPPDECHSDRAASSLSPLRGLRGHGRVAVGLCLCGMFLTTGCGEEASRPGDPAPTDAGGLGPETFCQVDVDCPGGACVAGRCRDRERDLGPGLADLGAERDQGGRDQGAGDLGSQQRDLGGGASDGGPGPRDGATLDEGAACEFDTDCPLPLICGRSGRCIPQCLSDRDCGEGESCHNGGCRAPGGGCLDPSECLPGEICHLRRCRPAPECLVSGECPEGQRCVDGQCEAGGDEPDGGVEPDGGQPGCDPRAGGYGEVCECPDQCRSALCLGIEVMGRSPTCTSECSLMAPCPGIDLCLALGDGQRVCVSNDAGLECRGAFECIFACLSDPRGGASCTVPCEDASGCPQSWGCAAVLSDVGVQRMCLPAGGMCSGAAQCPGGRCLPYQPGDPVGFCTLDCRDARDCPGGWSCCAVQDGYGDWQRVCYDGPTCPF